MTDFILLFKRVLYVAFNHSGSWPGIFKNFSMLHKLCSAHYLAMNSPLWWKRNNNKIPVVQTNTYILAHYLYCRNTENKEQRMLYSWCFVEETQPVAQPSKPAVPQGTAPLSAPPTPDSPGPSTGALMPSPATPLPQPASSSSPGCVSSNPEPSGATVGTPGNGETEEDKAKKLLYCSLCKVVVNSLSQLEAHNKGELFQKHQHAQNLLLQLHKNNDMFAWSPPTCPTENIIIYRNHTGKNARFNEHTRLNAWPSCRAALAIIATLKGLFRGIRSGSCLCLSYRAFTCLFLIYMWPGSITAPQRWHKTLLVSFSWVE